MKRGFLLMNTGSPDSPEVKDVKSYLGQFLMDPYVIDLPYPLRAILVYGIILNTRPKKSAEAYKSIWTDNGSPLIYYCEMLTKSLKLSHDEPIELAMAYGNPSLPNAIDKLIEADVEEICLLPLFPQYAMATVGSCIGWLKKILNQWNNDTGDTFPEILTKDWYLREQEKFNESSLLKTEFHGVRGEMPGSSALATKNNNKGPF